MPSPTPVAKRCEKEQAKTCPSPLTMQKQQAEHTMTFRRQENVDFTLEKVVFHCDVDSKEAGKSASTDSTCSSECSMTTEYGSFHPSATQIATRPPKQTKPVPRVSSSPALLGMDDDEYDGDETFDLEVDVDGRDSMEVEYTTNNTTTEENLNRVHSMPSLAVVSQPMEEVASASTLPTSAHTKDPFVNMNPEELLRIILESQGHSAVSYPALELKGFFLEPSEEQIRAYDNEVVHAVRCQDVDALRRMHNAGKILQCCNRFGESIVHMACRKGSSEVIRFLVEEAGVSIRVHDDLGRSPLHDACWTQQPNFELMRMLIGWDPDLLLVCDKRRHSPLGYVRREHWGVWCQFLNSNHDLLIPRELVERNVMF